MSNRLATENSPYLLQHAENPVDWYPWGSEALQKSKAEDKPIFLSIGYAACHWCHVMAHESFEDPETARLMNDRFINIKVDREERPELDQIYMNAVVAMTGQGGWPLSVFLTPEGKPFFGGTYFPPVSRYNMPAFREVLLSVARAWENDREEILRSGAQITDHINRSSLPAPSETNLPPDALDKIAEQLANGYDWKFGGWGSAPKFPQPMAIEFLVFRATFGDTYARDIAVHALETMALGGMYDVVGGGFARYSTDNQWLVPHFEKMLYDNALLARVYLHAHLITGNPRFRKIAEETLDFIRRELTHPAGGFFSSLDADSEGEEGKYYVWTPAQIQAALPTEEDRRLVTAAYGITTAGNFEGANILQRKMSNEELAEEFSATPAAINAQLTQIHSSLLATRQERVPPATDDKVLTGWNGLALTAFAEAARYLQQSDYLEIAIRNADFLLKELYATGSLSRNWRDGRAGLPAVLEDYGSLILGLLSLYQSDPDPRWFTAANQLMNKVMEDFQDPDGGFFDTSRDHETLIMRPKDLQDNAVPSGNSLAATALLQMAAYTGNGAWRDWAERMLAGILPAAQRYPTAFGQWLAALHFALQPVFEVAILSEPGDPASQLLNSVVWERYRPNLVLAYAEVPVPEHAPPLLHERRLIHQRPTAYVCQKFVCRQPVTEAADLREQLSQGSVA